MHQEVYLLRGLESFGFQCAMAADRWPPSHIKDVAKFGNYGVGKADLKSHTL
jgi:hypothetical protein